jgi:hypothetical protein
MLTLITVPKNYRHYRMEQRKYYTDILSNKVGQSIKVFDLEPKLEIHLFENEGVIPYEGNTEPITKMHI